jgi:leader peptidase (prepilin peptidase)/N-methyltransferase
MAGAWLGLGGLGISMALAVFSGAAVGTLGRWTGRLGPRQPFPFGPFIAFGIWMTWLMGEPWWWQRWLALMGGT